MSLKSLSGAGWLKDIKDNFDALGGMGTYTAVAADATADTLSIDTGLTDATMFIVQILRADVDVTGDAVISLSSGVLTVADGASTYAITADDVINYLVF